MLAASAIDPSASTRMSTSPAPSVEVFHHALTSAFAYLVFDAGTRQAVVIDPVLDFDRRSGSLTTQAADQVLARAHELDLQIESVFETHAHADHLSAAAYIKDRLGCRVATGAGICEVQASAARLFGFDEDFPTDGSQFDHLWHDGDTFQLGAVAGSVIATPGHTPDSVSYLVGDCLFVGDTLFIPELGTARCDFPGASARELYASIRKLYGLRDSIRVFVGHDYPPANREPVHVSDIAAEKRANAHLNETTSSDAFISFREQRDRTLALPDLFYFALQVNVCAGRLPAAAAKNQRFFHVPIHNDAAWPR
jgi:glyoxylase-like metal-dependent hydrolase (beta-lactamase superfamily II)